MTDNLLSVKEAAEYLRISIHTLRTWMSNKKVTYVKLGRRVLFRREDLDKLINKSVIEARHSLDCGDSCIGDDSEPDTTN